LWSAAPPLLYTNRLVESLRPIYPYLRCAPQKLVKTPVARASTPGVHACAGERQLAVRWPLLTSRCAGSKTQRQVPFTCAPLGFHRILRRPAPPRQTRATGARARFGVRWKTGRLAGFERQIAWTVPARVPAVEFSIRQQAAHAPGFAPQSLGATSATVCEKVQR
jgi:hypothetical protein